MLLAALLACQPKNVDLDDTSLPELGDPWVGFVANADSGTFRSDCEFVVDIYDEADNLVYSFSLAPTGRDWAGTMIEGEELLYAVATWSSCTNGPAGDGTMTSAGFSGQQGDVLVFRYNGTTTAFETLVQRDDFDGGEAWVDFEDGADSTVADVADSTGVEATQEDGRWHLTWDSALSVGKVLGAFSNASTSLGGEPQWIEVPDWW
jgi:hypothetical protein